MSMFVCQDYQFFGTVLDTRDKLYSITSNQVPQLAVTAARFAGNIVLRLVHDHLLPMDTAKYDKIIRTQVAQINVKVRNVQRVSAQWCKEFSPFEGRLLNKSDDVTVNVFASVSLCS